MGSAQGGHAVSWWSVKQLLSWVQHVDWSQVPGEGNSWTPILSSKHVLPLIRWHLFFFLALCNPTWNALTMKNFPESSLIYWWKKLIDLNLSYLSSLVSCKGVISSLPDIPCPWPYPRCWFWGFDSLPQSLNTAHEAVCSVQGSPGMASPELRPSCPCLDLCLQARSRIFAFMLT